MDAASSWVGVVAVAVAVAAMAGVTVAGPDQPDGRTLVLLAVALAAYAVAVVQARRGALARRLILGAAVVATALALVGGPVGSTDVNSYAVYGRMVAAHHASPYSHVPADFPDDPWLPRMATFWHHTGSVYGPVFVGMAAAGMAWAGTSELRARLFFQALAALAFLACVLLVDRRQRGDPGALAFVALNPVLIAGVVNGGHNDILVGLAVLAGVLLVTDDRRPKLVAAGVVLALGALVKIIALLGLAALVVWAFVHLGRRSAAVLAGWGIGVTAAGHLAAGRSSLGPVLHAGNQAGLPSFWAYPRRWLSSGLGRDAAQQLTGKAALVVVGVVAVLVVLALVRDRSPSPATTAALFAFLVGGAYVMPWYPGWVLPVAALALPLRTGGRKWPDHALSAATSGYAGLLMLAMVERPSQLSGATYAVEHLLHDTVLPLVELGLIAAMIAGASRQLLLNRSAR